MILKEWVKITILYIKKNKKIWYHTIKFKKKCRMMLNTEDYEVLKNSFIDSQRLFDKLNNVAKNVENMEYDESGLYQEEEEMYERHWLKLSTKITDALDNSLDGYIIELVQNDSLELKELTFNLIQDDERSRIKVDYSEDGSLNISQIS